MGLSVAEALARENVGASLSTKPAALKAASRYAVKTPVFPFQKFPESAPFLGPEMRSIGEVMTTATTLSEAVKKGLLASGMRCGEARGRVVIASDAGSVRVVRDALRLLS
jgi:carbamoyl-phosphate synthase large subunit